MLRSQINLHRGQSTLETTSDGHIQTCELAGWVVKMVMLQALSWHNLGSVVAP